MVQGVHGAADARVFVSNTGQTATTGFPENLATEQVGFFRVDKRGRGVRDAAQAAPSYATSPFFKLGIGRAPYPAQKAIQPIIDNFPILTTEIAGKNIVKWTGTKADSMSQTEIWTLGYDGLDANKRLFSPKDYHEFILHIRLWGGPINQVFNQPSIRRSYHVDKGCIDKCLDVCDTNPGLADDYIADALLKQINADFSSGSLASTPISKFLKVTKLRKSAEVETPPTTLAATQYTLSVVDLGDNSALGVVQGQYPGYTVERTARQGITSTYQVWRPDSVGAPAAFTNTLPITLAICNECPSGYTLTPSTESYIVQRQIAPGTDLSTPAAQQTYANTIGSAYAASERGVTGVTGGGGTGYTNGTFPLVFAGGGGTGAAGTVTVTGGVVGTPVVTSKGYNYTSAPTVTAPGVTGGTGAAAYVATISAAPTTTSTFVSSTGTIATVRVNLPDGTRVLPAIGSDSIVSVESPEAYCTPPAGSTIAWTAGDTRTIAAKQWMLTLADTICGLTRLPELQAAYPDLVVSEQGTTDAGCARIYTTTNYSDPFIADECSVDQYVYHRPTPFFADAEWQEFVTPAVDPTCTTTEEDAPCVAAGLKFETSAFVYPVGECLYGYFQYDRSEVDPVYMQLSAVSGVDDFTMSPCDITSQVVSKIRETKFATGSGAVIREFEKATLLHYDFVHTTNPARNEAYGVKFAARPETWYDTYSLTVESNRSQHGIIGREGTKQLVTYTFAFPAGMGKSYETLMNGYILSLGNPELTPVIL